MVLIYVWAFEQKRDDRSSAYLKGAAATDAETDSDRWPEVTETDTGAETLCCGPMHRLDIHRSRHEFRQQELLVPWMQQDKYKSKAPPEQEAEAEVAQNDSHLQQRRRLLRYYHVFRESELETLCASVSTCQLVRAFYEQGNWCVLLRKSRVN